MENVARINEYLDWLYLASAFNITTLHLLKNLVSNILFVNRTETEPDFVGYKFGKSPI